MGNPNEKQEDYWERIIPFLIHRNTVTVAATLAVIAMVFILGSLPKCLFMHNLRRQEANCTAGVTATVEAMRREATFHPKTGKASYTYYWTFRYTYSGQEYHEEYPFGFDSPMFSKGAEMFVWVDPAQPTVFRIEGDPLWGEQDYLLGMMLLMSIFPLLLTVLLVIRHRYNKPLTISVKTGQIGQETELNTEEQAAYEQWIREHQDPPA